MSKLRKSITFDMEDPQQTEVYNFLEKIRYFQTRFITKLVSDYIADNEELQNQDYKKLQNSITDFIYSNHISMNKEDNSQKLDKILSLLSDGTEKEDKDITISQNPVSSPIASGEQETDDTGLDDMMNSFKKMSS